MDNRTKTDFRALREMVGMTQSVLAHQLGVQVISVKRWENPSTEWMPPQDAWDVLDDARERQKWVVSTAVDKALETTEQAERDPEVIDLTYWHSAEDYEQAHPGEGWGWQMANANSRLAAARLEELGYKVAFGWGGMSEIEDIQSE